MVKLGLTACLSALVMLQPVAATERHIPTPRLKPAGLHASPTPVPMASKLNFPKLGFFTGWDKKQVLAARQDCADRLAGLDIGFEPLPPIGASGGCGAPAAIMVSSVVGVKIDPPAELTCAMAESLHGWVSGTVGPASRQYLKKRLVKINNASAYACRRRNNAKTGKLSEHGKANALDIASLQYEDGSSVNIKGDWSGLRQIVGVSANGRYLREIRRFACIRFTTVLGPGSDAFHKDHFHIDVARRNSGYRICK